MEHDNLYNDMTKQELANILKRNTTHTLGELPGHRNFYILSSHGSDYHVLFEIYSLFGQLRAILEQHLLKGKHCSSASWAMGTMLLQRKKLQ